VKDKKRRKSRLLERIAATGPAPGLFPSPVPDLFPNPASLWQAEHRLAGGRRAAGENAACAYRVFILFSFFILYNRKTSDRQAEQRRRMAVLCLLRTMPD
jgi:hypothetical protein